MERVVWTFYVLAQIMTTICKVLSFFIRYQIMWEFMKLRRAVVANFSVGMKRVLQGRYAFIHDAPILQYTTRSQYCGQMKLIGGFDHG